MAAAMAARVPQARFVLLQETAQGRAGFGSRCSTGGAAAIVRSHGLERVVVAGNFFVARSEDAPGELVGSPATLLLGGDQARYPIAGEVAKGCKYRPSLFRRDALCDAKGLTAVRRGLAPLLEKRWVAQVARNYCGKPMYGEFREFAADIAPAIAAAYEAIQLSVFWDEEVTHLNAALKKRHCIDLVGCEGKR